MFLEGESVENMRNNKVDISIGKGTRIRGNLLTFKFGGEILIGDNCYVGEDPKIGEEAIVAAGAVITKNVPLFVLMGGNPAKILKKIQ